MKEIVVIIPSYCPPDTLVPFCEGLRQLGFEHILVVNDGSHRDYEPIFDRILKCGIDVVTSTKNRGKGHAIKTGIVHAMEAYPDSTHYIFCDDDGQHSLNDVLRVAKKSVSENLMFAIGERDFSVNTPWKSLLGNRFTSTVLGLCHGIRAPDSQSGLRCISCAVAPLLLKIKEDRFGFELRALILIYKSGIKIEAIPIETIYFNGNSRTRFKPIRDSLAVITIALGLKD